LTKPFGELGMMLMILFTGALLTFLMPGDAAALQSTGVKVTAFVPAHGAYYAGQYATSSLRFKNTGNRARTFWVGYNVQDSAGRWHDVPSHSVELKPGQVSAVQSKSWRVPSNSLTTTGPYRVRMSVWNSRPENGGATRLASVERSNSFQAFNFRDDFSSFDETRWSMLDQRLGRSRLYPANVGVGAGSLRIKIPANTLDGGTIRSQSLYKHGTYSARMKTPDAPSSVTGFFLYDAPDYEKEIDIEIYNDSSRKIIFSTYAPHYANGTLLKEPTHTVTKTLPFDPASGFHDYTFGFYPGRVSFYVDGQLMQSWSDALPKSSMRLWVNTWFPTWLEGTPPNTDRYLYVDRLQH
jgi:endo-1,3-1,4-beta-glycanase ExoK